MLTIHCTQRGSRVLVPERHIRSLTNTERGIVLNVECWCGETVQLTTGRKQHVH